jgi:hypothetical protein
MNKLKSIFKIVILVSAFLLGACSAESLSKKELIKYLNNEKNGTVRSRTELGKQYKLVFRPSDLVIERELAAKKLNPDSLKASLQNRLYFILSLSADSAELFRYDNERFGSLLKDVSFRLAEYISLKDEENKQEFFLSDFICPRTYGMGSSTSVLLCFDDKDLSKTRKYTLYIRDFLNESPDKLKFEFDRTDLEKVPRLKL